MSSTAAFAFVVEEDRRQFATANTNPFALGNLFRKVQGNLRSLLTLTYHGCPFFFNNLQLVLFITWASVVHRNANCPWYEVDEKNVHCNPQSNYLQLLRYRECCDEDRDTNVKK